MHLLLFFSLVALLASCDMLRDQLDGNQAPVIDTFKAEPSEGEAPLTTSFTWTIADIEGDALACTLDFGDGASVEVQNCAQVTNAFHEYTTPGSYVTIFTATDGTTNVSRSAGIRVKSASDDTQ